MRTREDTWGQDWNTTVPQHQSGSFWNTNHEHVSGFNLETIWQGTYGLGGNLGHWTAGFFLLPTLALPLGLTLVVASAEICWIFPMESPKLGQKIAEKQEDFRTGGSPFWGNDLLQLDDRMTYWPNLCWGFHVDVEIPKVSSIIS